jgi:hypothetical protein
MKKGLFVVTISIILYIIILLITASPFNTSTNLFENNSTSFTLHYNVKFAYAEHDNEEDDSKNDLDKVCFKNDGDDDDDDDDYEKTVCYDDDDQDLICFENDNDETLCLDQDDDDYDNFVFTNSPNRSEEGLSSFSASTDDHSSSVRNPLPPSPSTLPDSQLEQGIQPELKGSDITKKGRSSDYPDLTNPDPFSSFQDPIPPQPGQPLHPTRPSNPTLPTEPAEPRAPLVPPPSSP